MAPASELAKAGIAPVGRMSYELADGTVDEYAFGLAQIEFMGEITAGRVIFGPEGVAPILGVTAMESVGITIDPTTRTLKRLPAVPLKLARRATPVEDWASGAGGLPQMSSARGRSMGRA